MINIVKVKEDLTGKRFGRLTVIEQAEDYVISSGGHYAKWKCKCDCGNIIEANSSNLKRGTTKSCGCLRDKLTSERCLQDLTGQKFGRLTVIERFQTDNRRRVYWKCLCECNTETIVCGDELKNGHTKSCGCLARDVRFATQKKYNTYDLSGKFGIGYTFKGEEFYFDLEDYDKIKDYCWYKTRQGYIKTSYQKNNIVMHKLVMGLYDNNNYDKYDVDHIYHNKNDNRKSQLRLATRSQNSMNCKVKSTNTSGVTGVSWDKDRNKWIANIKVNYKNIYLGRYDNIKDAIKARQDAEIKYFGEYRYKGDNNDIS